MAADGGSGAGKVRTPREVIDLYWNEVWNKGNAELIREICADPMVRHDVGRVTYMSHEDQIARVKHGHELMKPHFTHEVLVADDTYASSVWNMTSAVDPELKICSIETFKVENGRFVACWNAPYGKGLWGYEGMEAAVLDVPPPELVSKVGEIDAGWLERMYAAAGIKVPHVALVQSVEPVGKGTSCAVYRLHIAYNVEGSGGAPETLVAKLPSPDPEHAARIGTYVDYGREVAAYRFLADTPAFRTPYCYHAAYQPGGAFNLILEDMTGKGRPGDQVAGCSIADAGLVVRELGALHAAHWTSDEVAKLDWPLRIQKDAALIAGAYAAGIAALRAGKLGVRPAEDFALMDEVAPLVERWLAAEPLLAMIHGEPRVDNIFFEEEGGVATRACLIDLQQVGIGDPQRDIAYFLSGSLSPADRRACERELVAAHAAAIRVVDPSYEADRAWADYRANAVAGLIYTVAAVSVIVPSADTIALIDALLDRNLATVRDLDGVAAAKGRMD